MAILATLILWPLSGFATQKIHSACLNFFEKEKAVPGEPSCIWKCQAIPNVYIKNEMIMCGGYCDQFCSSKPKVKPPYGLADLYPGLTDQERLLASNEPVKMLEAYGLAWEAEKICLSIFPVSDTNDESDACRHFMWAGLPVNKFGPEFSSQVLEAHEMNPLQPKNEEKMDSANNKLGLEIGAKLSQNSQLNEDSLKKAFLENLNLNKVIVIRKTNRGTK